VPLALGEEARRDDPRLARERGIQPGEGPADQLRDDERPGRIGLPPMCRDARKACSAAGSHIGTDLGARAGEDDREVRDVAGHEQRDSTGMDEVLCEGDDRSGPRHILARSLAPRLHGDPQAG
jgi:hypothetical protein